MRSLPNGLTENSAAGRHVDISITRAACGLDSDSRLLGFLHDQGDSDHPAVLSRDGLNVLFRDHDVSRPAMIGEAGSGVGRAGGECHEQRRGNELG